MSVVVVGVGVGVASAATHRSGSLIPSDAFRLEVS